MSGLKVKNYPKRQIVWSLIFICCLIILTFKCTQRLSNQPAIYAIGGVANFGEEK
jgi:hypothetical protein